jgi:hypothetical protein
MSNLPSHPDKQSDFERVVAQVEQELPRAWIASDDDPVLVGSFVRLDRGNTACSKSFRLIPVRV